MTSCNLNYLRAQSPHTVTLEVRNANYKFASGLGRTMKFIILPFYSLPLLNNSLPLLNNSIQKACVGVKPDRRQTKVWMRTDYSGNMQCVRAHVG